MLCQVRRHLRVLAAAVLLSVSTLGAWSTVAHGLDCYDADGAPVLVAHDASAHAFRNAPPGAGERVVHCVLCHWKRAVGHGVQSVAATPFVVARTFAIPDADASAARLAATVQPPLRAPPSAAFAILA